MSPFYSTPIDNSLIRINGDWWEYTKKTCNIFRLPLMKTLVDSIVETLKPDYPCQIMSGYPPDCCKNCNLPGHNIFNDFLYLLIAKLSPNSPCLRQRLETRRSGSHVFTPTCKPDGRYDTVQCNESVCFCVDDTGKEIVGTRVSRQHHLNCTKSTTNLTGLIWLFLCAHQLCRCIFC